MMENYHVRFGGQGMSDALTPTYVFYRRFGLYCLSSSYGARIHGAWEGCLFGLRSLRKTSCIWD